MNENYKLTDPRISINLKHKNLGKRKTTPRHSRIKLWIICDQEKIVEIRSKVSEDKIKIVKSSCLWTIGLGDKEGESRECCYSSLKIF